MPRTKHGLPEVFFTWSAYAIWPAPGLFVDGEGPRRPYFVLAAVTPANLAAVIVLDDVVVAQLLVQRPRAGRHSFVAGNEWENGRLDGRDLRVEAEDDALAVADDLLVV